MQCILHSHKSTTYAPIWGIEYVRTKDINLEDTLADNVLYYFT